MRFFRIACAAVVLCGEAASVQGAGYGGQDVEVLRQEVRTLRLEVALLQADYLTRIIAGLEGESARVEERLRRLEKEERNLREQMDSAERTGASRLSANERLEVDAMAASRELRPGSDLVRILSEKQDLAQRASDLARQIQWERQQRQAALTTADRVKAELARAQAPASSR